MKDPQNIKLLLVDDLPELREVLAVQLRREGFEVIEAVSGEEALSLLGQQKFDVILSDIQMPGLNGISLARRVSEKWPTLPVVLMTGNPDLILGLDGADSVDGVFGKPLDIAEFIALLQKVCP